MKNMRKALSLIMVFAMLCGLMVTTAFASDYNPTPLNNLTELQNMDLDGDYYLNTNITINASNWTPIGNASTPFTGTFDGKGNNYTITWTGSAAGSSYYGIFGNSIFSHIISKTASACDARTGAAMSPVMSTSGSGNQGIGATNPVAVYAEENENTEEELIRALRQRRRLYRQQRRQCRRRCWRDRESGDYFQPYLHPVLRQHW